jgi:predicted permease
MRLFDDRRRDIDEELRLHLQARIDHLIAQGVTPELAREEALRRFGDLDRGRAVLYAQADARERRRRFSDRLDAFLHDLLYVARSLRRQPVFTLGVVATLALGIGLNAAVFGIADRVLFRAPEAVVDPDDLRRVETLTQSSGSDPLRVAQFSYPEAELIVAASALQTTSINTPPRVLVGANGRDVAVAYVDDAFFPVLGLSPASGRFFAGGEGQPGAAISVAVVSFAYWLREFGARPLTSDATVRLGNREYSVVGVAPARFTGIDLDPVDVWLPLGVGDFGRGMRNGVVFPWYRSDMLRAMRIIGRLRPDLPDDAAAAKLSSALAARDGDGTGREPRRAALVPIVPIGGASVTESSRRMLARLVGLAAIVLLIACANATHLLLARGLRRGREIATRLALGASRARVWRLLVLESVVLALIGGAAAAWSGGWAASGLRAMVFPDARWTTSIFDLRTLLFTGALAIAAGLIAGIAPAAQAISPDLVSAIKSVRGSGRRARITRGALLVAQTALSIVLLVASGLLVVSLMRLNAVNLGFNPAGLFTVSFTSTSMTADTRPDAAAMAALAERVRASRSDVQVSLASNAPFNATRAVDVIVPGTTYKPPTGRDVPRLIEVSTNFFHVLGTRVVWGRGFTADDVTGEAIAVVNETMARNYWSGTIPAGACVLRSGSPCARVVGIVEDVRDTPGAGVTPMRFYLPLDPAYVRPATLVVRVDGDAAVEAQRVRAMLPGGARVTVDVISHDVARALRPWRTAAALFLALGAIALTLACVGVYSIISYSASERVHELGLRVALGATRGDLLRLVLGSGLRLAIVGGLVGLAAAAAGGRLLSSLLYDVSPFSPPVYALALVCLTVAGAAAMLPAALRASRVDAVVALREE